MACGGESGMDACRAGEHPPVGAPLLPKPAHGPSALSCNHPSVGRRTKKGPPLRVALCIGGGGGNRTRVRRHSIPGTTCLAHRWISFPDSTVCEAHRGTSL